jgi:hypothetical protein
VCSRRRTPAAQHTASAAQTRRRRALRALAEGGPTQPLLTTSRLPRPPPAVRPGCRSGAARDHSCVHAPCTPLPRTTPIPPPQRSSWWMLHALRSRCMAKKWRWRERTPARLCTVTETESRWHKSSPEPHERSFCMHMPLRRSLCVPARRRSKVNSAAAANLDEFAFETGPRPGPGVPALPYQPAIISTTKV